MARLETAVTRSVVLASCRASELVADAVRSLRRQCEAESAELIVARSVPVGAHDPEGLFEGCKLVACSPEATIPEIRGAGLAAATGEWALLTEDNCVPRRDWVSRLSSGFDTGAAVVGGTMGNAHPDRAVDAGAFFAEYGFFGQSRSLPGGGASPFVTGANVAYHRSVLKEAAAWAGAGEWEGVIHHRLAARGIRFGLVNDAVVEQNVHCELASFARDRFDHGRQYAAVRSKGWGRGRRFVLACATPLLPPLLTWRAWQSAGRAEPGVFVKALPYTLAFLIAWGAGEASGYLAGRIR